MKCLPLCFATIIAVTSCSEVRSEQIDRATSSTQADITIQPYSSYVLGPGDQLGLELFDIPELSGVFTIGPDGTLYLPRLRSIYVSGLTLSQLQAFLTSSYREFVKDPIVYLRPISYRPVRVYVGGEISRPGYYTLGRPGKLASAQLKQTYTTTLASIPQAMDQTLDSNKSLESAAWPTLFDAIRIARGITPYSDLSEVTVTRRLPYPDRDSRIEAQVDFLDLIRTGNEVVNIPLFDGDVIKIRKSDKVLRDQLLEASRTNLSPDQIEVFVAGSVKAAGPKILPQGSTLNQAIASSGGPQLLHGSIRFIRIDNSGDSDIRSFRYNKTTSAGSYNNPVLMQGDIVYVEQSILSSSIEVLNQVTGPAVGLYSVYSLFKP